MKDHSCFIPVTYGPYVPKTVTWKELVTSGQGLHRRFEYLYSTQAEATIRAEECRKLLDDLGVLYDPIAVYVGFGTEIWHVQVRTLGRKNSEI